MRATGSRRPGGPATDKAPAPAGETADEGLLMEDLELDIAVDPAALAQARSIAAQLHIRRAPRNPRRGRGSGAIARMPFVDNADDIDLDATLERLVDRAVPDQHDIIVRDRMRSKRSVVLAVDVSGSMRGERIRTIAATVGALALELNRDNVAVIAFWSDAVVLCPLGRPMSPERLLHTVLRVPARGLTNVALPLQEALRQLGRVAARDARVLLLSDCVHNAGPDPRSIAARLPRLDVLLETSGEHDAELGRELSRLGRGRMAPVRTYREVPRALSNIFSD